MGKEYGWWHNTSFYRYPFMMGGGGSRSGKMMVVVLLILLSGMGMGNEDEVWQVGGGGWEGKRKDCDVLSPVVGGGERE